jgi:hypothetical protein
MPWKEARTRPYAFRSIQEEHAMAKHGSKDTDKKVPDHAPGRTGAVAGSVDREPDPNPTPQDHGAAVSKEDEPKGHPTSDRFQSEQAHRKGAGKT